MGHCWPYMGIARGVQTKYLDKCIVSFNDKIIDGNYGVMLAGNRIIISGFANVDCPISSVKLSLMYDDIWYTGQVIFSDQHDRGYFKEFSGKLQLVEET